MMRRSSRGRRLVLMGAAAAVSAVGLGPAAAAQAAGQFECTSTALRIGNNSTSVANPQRDPCANDLESPINVFVPLGSLGSVTS
jgi:hypothetical protein